MTHPKNEMKINVASLVNIPLDNWVQKEPWIINIYSFSKDHRFFSNYKSVYTGFSLAFQSVFAFLSFRLLVSNYLNQHNHDTIARRNKKNKKIFQPKISIFVLD